MVDAAWSIVSPQLQPIAGGVQHPSVRYSACSVSYNNPLIVTHGYHYNHEIRHPAWKSDAWSFDYTTQAWRKVHEGERDGAPSARYSGSCVLWDHALWMYGGDDGGHKYRMHNYVFGAHFNEMWRLDLRSFEWRKVIFEGDTPVKRALHASAVLGNEMYVHGGLELSDTWKFHFPTRTWQELATGQADDGNHPGRRHAHQMAAGDGCVYLFGGGRVRHAPTCSALRWLCAALTRVSGPRPAGYSWSRARLTTPTLARSTVGASPKPSATSTSTRSPTTPGLLSPPSATASRARAAITPSSRSRRRCCCSMAAPSAPQASGCRPTPPPSLPSRCPPETLTARP